jgi:hypothetical protein
MLLTSQHCQQVFSKVIPGYSNQAFLDNNSKTPTYMVPAVLGPDPSTWGDIASTPQSYIGGSPDEDVGTRFYRSSVDAYTTPDYSSVVVGPNFFSNPSSQTAVLFHEDLHAYSKMNDPDMLKAFSKYGLKGNGTNTQPITDWLSNDCH